MKRIIVFVVLLFCASLFVVWMTRQKPIEPQTQIPEEKVTGFSLTSDSFRNGGAIPVRFTCDGDNISPPFTITSIPQKTKSLAIIADDIDTPQQTWVHWLVWNIPPDTLFITEGSVPSGAVVGTNSFGNISYGGPCPPSGRHRYIFRLYALDTYLVLSQTAIKKDVIDAMNTHVLGQTELMGYYER